MMRNEGLSLEEMNLKASLFYVISEKYSLFNGFAHRKEKINIIRDKVDIVTIFEIINFARLNSCYSRNMLTWKASHAKFLKLLMR